MKSKKVLFDVKDIEDASKGKHEFFAPPISTEPLTPLLEPLMIYSCIKFYFDFARVIPTCP